MDTKLQIRCSEEQKQEWTRAAGGERSLSEWMRATLDHQARLTLPVGRKESYSEHLEHEGGQVASGKFGEEETTTIDEIPVLKSEIIPPGTAVLAEVDGMPGTLTGVRQDDGSVDWTTYKHDVVLPILRSETHQDDDPTGLDPGILSTGQELRSWPEGGLPHGEHPYDYGYDDTAPEPEDPYQAPPPPATPPPIPPAIIEPSGHMLPSPTCRNAVYHWKLTTGEACPYCDGQA